MTDEQDEQIQKEIDWRARKTQVKLVAILLLALVGGPLCAIGAGVVTAALIVPLFMASPSIALLTSAAGAVATHFVIARRRRA